MKEKDMCNNDVIDEIEKTSNSCIVKNLPAISEWCSTGCSVLDLAIANKLPGGIPVGRIVHAFGGGSTCKTVLAVTILGYAQRSNKIAHFADIEHTLDASFAEIYGLDCSNEKTFKLAYPSTLEELFDNYISSVVFKEKKKKKLNTQFKVIAVDSITALPSGVEQDGKMEDATYGATRAKQMSLGLRKYIFFLAESNTTLFCIDQTRDNIGQFGKKEVTSGGRALEFYSSVQIYLKHDCKIVNSSGKVIGVWIKFRIDKNKVGPPFREGRFRILFDHGLDNISSSLYFLSEQQNGEKDAKKKSTMIKLWNEEKKIVSWIRHIEDNNLEEDLQKEVWEVWKEIYKTEERKCRIW